MLAGPAAASNTFTGQAVLRGLRESVDVVDAHAVFLQAQANRGEPLLYLNWTSRWAPGRALLADGQGVAGNLSRTQFNLGAGFGSIGGLALFGGANLDLTGFTNPAWTPIPNMSALAGGETLLFLGVAAQDIQLTVASKQRFADAQALNLDPWGNYRPQGESGLLFRPGTPWAISSPDSGDAWLTTVFSLYESRSGAFLSFTMADVPQIEVTTNELGRQYASFTGTQKRITDVRFQFQPLRITPRWLLETVGIPMLGIRRLDPMAALLLEGAVDLYETLTRPEDVGAGPLELDLGSDDVLAGGFRWRIVQRVVPEVVFRRVELAYVDEHDVGLGILRVGARAILHRQLEEYVLAGEGYLLLGPGTESGSLDFVSFGLSYSYNTPDTTTFLPLPNAHVLGFQVVFGAPEAVRPLIPLVRAVSESQGRRR